VLSESGSEPSDRKVIRRALVSVYDKTGLIELGKALRKANVEILSTGSTAKTLAGAGIAVTEVSDYTSFPEIMGGRVKTLHPRIHSGILADQSNPAHLDQIAKLDIAPFDLVVVNLYPFARTIASGASFADCIEQIDIGGPSMLRGAAKNHGSVAVICSPLQYAKVHDAIAAGGFTSRDRQDLALEVFRTTAEYDLSIANWLAGTDGELPEWFGAIWAKKNDLRYGENPHQSAAIYSNVGAERGLVGATQLHGKEMSFNNYTDADAAWRAAHDHADPCVAIIKHANPCGIAIAKTISVAHQKAHACDPVSAFGGVVAANREVDVAMAQALSHIFTEVVIAPSYEAEALEILSKKPSIRILQCSSLGIAVKELRPVSGGMLVQQTDLIDAPGDDPANWTLACGPALPREVLADLVFAWRSVRAVKSNAILLAKDGASVGIGMGQVNRVDSSKLAVTRAGDRVHGCVAASDAYFPFADGLEILLGAGVVAVVQPGGSVRDDEVIAAARAANISMYFTGVRHFSHA
jgi:phosphoribosylaminoimidazolecarboxamide formyltransferase/IMP cyclohydrolase